MHLLLADSLSARERGRAGTAGLDAELRAAAILDAARERELQRLIHAFTAAGIDTLLLKGAGLAYTVYRAPHLRPRVDVDLLIAAERRTDADHLLRAKGWTRAAEPNLLHAAAQQHYRRSFPSALTEQLDLHWRIANPRVFGEAVAFDELLARAVPVPLLGSGARTLGRADALLAACIHRAAHHDDAIDLLWLWDIHLLASGLLPDEAAGVVDFAARRRMRAVCARGLTLAAERFQTPGVSALLEALEQRPSVAEPSVRFLGGGLTSFDLLCADFAATPAWRVRIAMLREHLFPSRTYMKATYAWWPTVLLPLAYAYRLARGAPKWFRRPAHRLDRDQR